MPLPSKAIIMLMRTRRHKMTFEHAFTLKGVDRTLSPGDYEVVTDEELIEGLSFPAYRRVASWILTPEHNSSSATEMIMIDPAELAAAHSHDTAYKN